MGSEMCIRDRRPSDVRPVRGSESSPLGEVPASPVLLAGAYLLAAGEIKVRSTGSCPIAEGRIARRPGRDLVSVRKEPMTIKNDSGIDLTQTFVHLEDGGGAVPVECTAEFWKETASGKRRYDRIMGSIQAKRAEDLHPSMWEMHPGGDELLYLVLGAIDVILEEAGGERAVSLNAGRACVVPRGVWHRLVMREPSHLLFINSRTGMQHRPV